MDINRYSPSYTISKRHMITIAEYSPEEIFEILYATKVMKSKFIAREKITILDGHTIALFFADVSLRTRMAISIGVKQMGGNCVSLSYSKEDLEAGENIKDILQVIARYGVGALITRSIESDDLKEFKRVSGIPIINSSNEDGVPMQALSDMFTIWEKFRRLEGVKLAYVGKATNTAASVINAAVKCGMHVSIATPAEFALSEQHIKETEQYGTLHITTNPIEAVKGADVIYTDQYYYHDATPQEEKSILSMYKVNTALVSFAKPGCLIMHPLPATRGLEITEEVIDGKNSIVYDQGENRLHTVKAVLAMLVQ